VQRVKHYIKEGQQTWWGSRPVGIAALHSGLGCGWKMQKNEKGKKRNSGCMENERIWEQTGI